MSITSLAEKVQGFATDPLEYSRQTGRTTRMMKEAAAVAESGKSVVVVFKDEMAAKHWRAKYADVNGLSVIPMKARMPELDWKEQRIIAGPYAFHQTFIDHDVIYLYHKELFKAYHQYDRPMDHPPYVTP